MLGERVLALDLEGRPAVPGQAVEEDRLLHRRHQRVPDAPQERVVGPYRQFVLPAFGQLACVVDEVALRVVLLEPERLGHAWVDPPPAGLDVRGRDERVGLRVRAPLIHDPCRMEHLQGVVGVEARNDLRDRAQVAVHELTQAPVVLHRAGARPPGHEELESGDAERVLHVDHEQAQAELVLRGSAQAVAPRPPLGLARTSFVIHAPHLADAAGIDSARVREARSEAESGGPAHRRQGDPAVRRMQRELGSGRGPNRAARARRLRCSRERASNGHG